MKRIWIILILLGGIFFNVNAQKRCGNSEYTGNCSVCSDLNLDSSQKEKMQALKKDLTDKLNQIKKDNSLTKQEKVLREKSLREEHKMQVEKILTAEQLVEWNKLKEIRKMKPRPLSSHFINDSVVSKLNLTKDQKANLQNIRTNFNKDLKNLKADYHKNSMEVLTPEQRESIKDVVTLKRLDDPRKDNERMQKRLENMELTDDAKNKLKKLDEDYYARKGSIERSRIAPDMQKKQLEDLEEQYKKDRRQIMKEGFQLKNNLQKK